MTDKQRKYLELCRQGHSLREIAAMTGRTRAAVWRTIQKAVNLPCRGTQACRACELRGPCGADYELVRAARLWTRFRPVAAGCEEEPAAPRGRYSY